jgi:hypothetical protein
MDELRETLHKESGFQLSIASLLNWVGDNAFGYKRQVRAVADDFSCARVLRIDPTPTGVPRAGQALPSGRKAPCAPAS